LGVALPQLPLPRIKVGFREVLSRAEIANDLSPGPPASQRLTPEPFLAGFAMIVRSQVGKADRNKRRKLSFTGRLHNAARTDRRGGGPQGSSLPQPNG